MLSDVDNPNADVPMHVLFLENWKTTHNATKLGKASHKAYRPSIHPMKAICHISRLVIVGL
jgi:hypothetical protein